MSRCGLMWVAFLGVLAVAGTASAAPVAIPLSDFVVFSGGTLTVDGGDETSIGGHTLINGNIGSNQDLFMQGNPLTGYPAQLNGSAYAGGNLTFGQDLTVGSSTGLREVVANGAANIGGGATIWGTLDAFSATLGSGASVTGGVTEPPSKTFSLITMPAATTFTAGGANRTVPAGQGSSLTVAPGTYGTLATSSQNQSVVLSSGDYYFNAITTQGGFDLQIDLTSGNPVNIYVVGNADFAGRQTLLVKGEGTGGDFVPISDAQALASLIYLETHARFTMTGGSHEIHNIWGGTVYASLLTGGSAQVVIGQYTDWYGAAYALDSFQTADHGTWNYVAAIPEPATLLLLSLGGVALIRKHRRVSLRNMRFLCFLALMVFFSFTSQNCMAMLSTDLDSYVLFATGEGLSDNATPLSFKGGNTEGTGYVWGGNVGVNRADGKLGNSTQMIAVGLNGKFIMSPGTQLVGDSIQLGDEAVVYDVYRNQQTGTGWSTPGVINGTESEFTPPIFSPMPQLFDPSFTAGSIDIDVATGTVYNDGTPLAPGVYQDLSVKNGATIYLTAGTYTFRRFNTGQNFTVYTVPGTIVQVTGDTNPNSLDMQFNGNGSFVGSANPAIESVAEFRYLGTDVQFSDSSTFWGVILAPNASISLGRGNTLYGRFIGQQINSDFNDNIYYRIPEPTTLLLFGLGGLLLRKNR